MAAEALAEIGGEAVIDRAAVGVIGVHVAEGDAARVIEGGGRGIAFGIKAWQGREKSLRLSYARGLAAQIESGGDGRVQSSGTEEVHQGGIHVARTATTNGERAGGG